MLEKENLLQLLFLTLTGKYGLSKSEVETILPHVSLSSLAKNQIVKPYEHYESKLRIILSGIGGYFVRNNKGDDLCFYFAMTGELFTDFKSLFDQKQSRIELRAIKKLETADIDREIFVQFTEKNGAWRKNPQGSIRKTLFRHTRTLP